MSDLEERRTDKLLREWGDFQETEFYKVLSAAWDKLQAQAIEFTLTTHGYEPILRSRGEVDGIRKAIRTPFKIADDLRASKGITGHGPAPK